MSFGDPNNPYGPPQGQQPGYPPQQPQGQQPGYGYPQAPQGQQPGYGYPQAPPVQQQYGAPVPMATMPGTVSAARAMMWVIVGLQVIGAAIYAIAAVAVDQAQEDNSFGAIADYPTGVLWGIVALALVWLVWAAFLGTKFTSGGNGVRVTILVFGILTAVLGLVFTIAGIVHIVLGILIAVYAGNANGKAWFNRPRY
ncbi:hypothetical protein [Streptomyces flaveus]|uniref:Uncharacterized protein n=1 Tax=Streptomyces flaveus TaxID=66370 RepID=A0A917QUB8_9ACTN|nr:hypothetical protein [Streptomyces flaveus]GGK67603.1 hypothetical protein GCM10010094_30860 [Streptomyces flaveus]